jgi:hypothetical protein
MLHVAILILSLPYCSLKAGGVALNLTHANYIFLMDPWWYVTPNTSTFNE